MKDEKRPTANRLRPIRSSDCPKWDNSNSATVPNGTIQANVAGRI